MLTDDLPNLINMSNLRSSSHNLIRFLDIFSLICVLQVAKFNFNSVTNGNLAKSKVESVVNADTGRSMGDALLVEVLKKKHGFQKYLCDKREWVQKLEKILEDEVYIIGTIVKQLKEESSLPVKMKLFLLSVLGSRFSKIERNSTEVGITKQS